jgi:hypothetical protein
MRCSAVSSSTNLVHARSYALSMCKASLPITCGVAISFGPLVADRYGWWRIFTSRKCKIVITALGKSEKLLKLGVRLRLGFCFIARCVLWHCIRQILHWPKSSRNWPIIRYWPIGGGFNQGPWFGEYNRSEAFDIVRFGYILDSLVFCFTLYMILELFL